MKKLILWPVIAAILAVIIIQGTHLLTFFQLGSHKAAVDNTVIMLFFAPMVAFLIIIPVGFFVSLFKKNIDMNKFGETGVISCTTFFVMACITFFVSPFIQLSFQLTTRHL
ncbi:MAG: hypothetical protein ACNFW9_06095 [Candidatus Kerfeldbacteria bacterium]|jgi:hypothetical protein